MLICCIGSRPYGKSINRSIVNSSGIFVWVFTVFVADVLAFFIFSCTTPRPRPTDSATPLGHAHYRSFPPIRERDAGETSKSRTATYFLNEFFVEIEFLLISPYLNNYKYDRVLKQCKECLEIILMGFNLLPLSASVSPFDLFTFILYIYIYIYFFFYI